MKPPPFAYHAPRDVEEALDLLHQHGDDARPLAGGQSLIPVLNFRLAHPAVLVDLNGIAALSGIAADGDGVVIGAMTRQRAMERSSLVARAVPLLGETLPYVAHAQIRNRGTLGGSLAHADPAAELPAVAVTLGARMHLCSRSGQREVGAREFFSGFFSTALVPGELLVRVTFPAQPQRSGSAFEEVARRHGDFALLGVAAWLQLDDAGVCTAARVTFVNPGAGAEAALGAVAALVGQHPNAAVLRAAAEDAARELTATGDMHASPAYRRQLARVLTERVLLRAVNAASSHA